MARFDSGYIKFYRRAVTEDIGWSGVQLAVWVTLLCWASRFESKIRWTGGQRTIPPGTIVTAIRDLASRLGFSKDAVARALRALSERGSIRIESATRGTLITICNWAEYQQSGEDVATQARHGHDGKRTLAGRQPDLNGEVENKEDNIPQEPTQKPSAPCGAVDAFSDEEILVELLENVRQSAQAIWLRTYSDRPWIKTEMLKAAAWIETNPRKRPKAMARFLGNWLANGWERYRKSIPSQSSAFGAINTKPLNLEDIA